MAVMLSRPQGSLLLVPELMFFSKKAFRQSLLFEVLRLSKKYLVSRAVVSSYFSQIPSHPIMMISSLPVLSTSMMSGIQVTGCSLKASPGTFLWLKSPMDLVKLSPLTLPQIMGTPVFYILAFSMGFSGLWSKDSSTHLPFCHKAALESPALAQMILSLVMATTTAVAPAFRSFSVAGCDIPSLLYFSNS